MFQKLIRTEDDTAALMLRLTLGIVFFPHGAQKMLGWFGGHGFSGTMDFFTSSGMPWILAFLVIVGEFFGSIGLVVGFLGRIAAFGIGCIMVGAIFLGGHIQHGFFMNWFGNQQGEGFEYHLLAIGIALAVLIKGSGRLSVDRALSK